MLLLYKQFLGLLTVSVLCERHADDRTSAARVPAQIPDHLIKDLYGKYLEAVANANKTEATRRLIKGRKEFEIQVKNLKEVNGLMKHNLIVKEQNVTKPVMYINNPVESAQSHSYLSMDEFKKLMTDRLETQKQTLAKRNKLIKLRFIKTKTLVKPTRTSSPESMMNVTTSVPGKKLKGQNVRVVKIDMEKIVKTLKKRINDKKKALAKEKYLNSTQEVRLRASEASLKNSEIFRIVNNENRNKSSRSIALGSSSKSPTPISTKGTTTSTEDTTVSEETATEAEVTFKLSFTSDPNTKLEDTKSTIETTVDETIETEPVTEESATEPTSAFTSTAKLQVTKRKLGRPLVFMG